MVNKIIKPSWLCVIFSPGSASYSIVFENFSASLKSNNQTKKINYENSKIGHLKKGLFWNSLELYLNDKDVVYLKGLNNSKTSEISNILKVRSEFLSSLRNKLLLISDLIDSEAKWINCARNGDFWIAQSALENRIATCKQFEEYFHIPEKILNGLDCF